MATKIKSAQIDECVIGATTEITTATAKSSKPTTDIKDSVAIASWSDDMRNFETTTYADDAATWESGLPTAELTLTAREAKGADALENFLQSNRTNNVAFYLSYGEAGTQKEYYGIFRYAGQTATENARGDRPLEVRFNSNGKTLPVQGDV